MYGQQTDSSDLEAIHQIIQGYRLPDCVRIPFMETYEYLTPAFRTSLNIFWTSFLMLSFSIVGLIWMILYDSAKKVPFGGRDWPILFALNIFIPAVHKRMSGWFESTACA